jgi:colanic acid biosynthesis glycosyl transferase WcaI
MKILIVCQYFWPESFRINDVAISLFERGHSVAVLTGKPNYPEGKFYEGYNIFSKHRETYHGIDVIRVPIIPRGTNSWLQLTLNYISFAVFGSIGAILYARDDYDAILVYALSPLTQAIPAFILKLLGRGVFYIWLQDLWPESLSATGAVKASWILRLVGYFAAVIHRNARLNFISSSGFKQRLEEMGVAPGTIRYLPNYAEDIYGKSISSVESIKCDAAIPKGFRVMFAGNIGAAQDFPTILAAAERIKGHEHIQWIVAGDGRAFSWLKKEIINRDLQKVFHLLGRLPMEAMPYWYECASVMLVTLRAEPIFALTLPAKVQSYMAAAKPIIAAIDGEAAQVITQAKCGICVCAGDDLALAEAILSLAALDGQELLNMGYNGRQFYDSHFERWRVITQLEDCMRPA